MMKQLMNSGRAILLAGLAAVWADEALAEEMVPLPTDMEIELALSALPEDLQANAGIYLLDPEKGYVLHRQGSNGFVTFVGRTSTRFYEADWDYDYPADQLIPVAFDEIGAATHMPPWFDLALMRAKGVAPEEAKQRLRNAYADGSYKAPEKGGISYMLAPIHRAYMAPEASPEIMTVSYPHYMPYAPHSTAAQVGNMDPMNGGPIVLTHGQHDSGPHGYLVFMVQQTQADAIREKYAGLLDRLCGLNANWCLPGAATGQ